MRDSENQHIVLFTMIEMPYKHRRLEKYHRGYNTAFNVPEGIYYHRVESFNASEVVEIYKVQN